MQRKLQTLTTSIGTTTTETAAVIAVKLSGKTYTIDPSTNAPWFSIFNLFVPNYVVTIGQESRNSPTVGGYYCYYIRELRELRKLCAAGCTHLQQAFQQRRVRVQRCNVNGAALAASLPRVQFDVSFFGMFLEVSGPRMLNTNEDKTIRTSQI